MDREYCHIDLSAKIIPNVYSLEAACVQQRRLESP